MDSKVDWKMVETLMNVCDLARQWPPLKALHDEAMETLVVTNTEVAESRAKRAAEAKAKADAEVASMKAKADAEAEAEARKIAKAEALEAHPPQVGLFRKLETEHA